MERYVVYPGPDGTVTIADMQTGKSEVVKAPRGAATTRSPIRVRGYAPAASQMVCSLPAR